MPDEFTTTIAVAAAIGVTHTLMGPDHYVPFVALSRARAWSLGKTLLIASLCGIGHVAGSLVLGIVGAGLYTQIERLVGIENLRAQTAAWMLTAFGFAYLVWGMHRAVRNRPHTHVHLHADGTIHTHRHSHQGDHAHVHESPDRAAFTPWVLFIIFVFGPCEPLIPILMYPALQHGWLRMLLVAAVFCVATVTTILAAVTFGVLSLRTIRLDWLSPYTHALTGLAITACGAAILLGTAR